MIWYLPMQWLDAAPLLLVAVVLTLVFVSAEELGVRFRRFVSARRGTGDRDVDEGVGNLVGAALGLLALIFGFTYAMAQDRYDQRRLLVMSEARAVATSYLRFQAFDEPERGLLSQLMLEYTALRSRGIDPQRDRAGLHALVARTEQLQSEIWDAALRGLGRRPDLTEPVMESTNEMFEITATRVAMVDARIPVSIQAGLITFAVMSAFFTGYGLALDRRHRMAVVGLFLLFTFVYVLVLDLDRSYSGPIRVSQAPMVQAAAHIERLEAAKRAAAAVRPAP
ncbi:hypothetical protein LJR219_003023 [Phenylobacterium sp. LjRoot219]|uniref:bestrophin-like domain n=1 Tax=Phenylobacterium sp. LjRoot219 TaxID=3342283 RepID=UPI003ECE8561